MKKLFCITSHCPTEERKNKLIENINILKDSGFDVLLISHVPLSAELVSRVDHYIFNNINEVLFYPDRYINYWKKIGVGKKEVTMSSCNPDYGWAYCNQVKTIGNYCSTLQYEQYVFLNYDIVLTQSILDYISQNNFNFFTEAKETESIHTILYQLNKKDLLKISKSLFKKQYIDSENKLPIFLRNGEHYLHFLLLILDIPYQFNEIYPETFFAQTHERFNPGLNFNSINNDFKLFYDKKYIVLYDLINPIKFNINNRDILIKSSYIKEEEIKSIGYYDYDSNLVDVTYLLQNDYKKFNPNIQING